MYLFGKIILQNQGGKKMKKTIIITLTLLCLCFLAVSVNAADMVIKAGHSHSIEHPDTKGLELFKELVEEKTSGRIEVQIFPAGQLGNENEMLEQFKLGTLELTISGRCEQSNPKLAALGLPFLFRDYSHVEKVLYGPIGDMYADYAED